jgi:L-threonylcarbamoyladenylate synthase
MPENSVENAVQAVKSGGVIIYPTESVFGLGCDPFNESAVMKLLDIKQRAVEKGLILIASHVQQILPYIKPLSSTDLANALKTWPGFHTWVFPKSELVPSWVSGVHNSVAVRVSRHPTVKELCDRLGHSLISTSANVSNQDVLSSISEIKQQFGDKIDAYVDAPLGGSEKPSQIKDAHTLKIYR